MSTWELFLKNYNEASPEMRAFIDSDEISNFAHSYTSSQNQPPLTGRELVSLVADYALKVITLEELKTQLKLDDSAVASLSNTLEEKRKIFTEKSKGSKTTPIPEANLETKERLELRPNPTTGAPVETEKPSDGTGAKPLTREELMSALGGKRTMAADIEALRQKRDEAKNAQVPPSSPPPTQPPVQTH